VASVFAYATDRDRWVDVASLATARIDACATIGADGRIYVAGGYDATNFRSVEIYGPVIALSPALAASGDTVVVAGSNFAAGAPVALAFDGKPIAIGTSNDAGNIALSFRVPAIASGVHEVVGLDDRSQFPTRALLQVR
jgi:hypothetical protein